MMGETKEHRGGKPPCLRADALAVVKRLREAGHIAYFAGGCVRDVLLGLQPKDWDVATDAEPTRVRELFRNTQAVGAVFGVILVREGKSVVEVATFRSDQEYVDGRRPAGVRFTTAEEDAQRRDFTINGLFLDPYDGDRVIDYVGGVEDLKAKRLRAIGDARRRFAEDHLRLLRAVRFAARFGLAIESQTAEAVLRDAPLLKRISPERIGEELRLMLTPTTRQTAWELMWRFGLVNVIWRFLPVREGIKFDPKRSILLAMGTGDTVKVGLALAAATLCVQWQGMQSGEDIRLLLTRASVQHMAKAMRQSLKISNEESDQMQGTLEGAGWLLDDEKPTMAKMKRFLARTTASMSRRLMAGLCGAGILVERIEWAERQLAELEKTDFAPLPLITGDDLTAAGLQPGPRFKHLLNRLYDAQLEGLVKDRAEAMRMAIELANTGLGGGKPSAESGRGRG